MIDWEEKGKLEEKAEQKRIIQLASKVTDFFIDLSKKYSERWQTAQRPYPEDDFAFGEAIYRWCEDGRPGKSWFSTEDPLFLEFSQEIEAEFGLEVVTRAEAKRREVKQEVLTYPVCGFLGATPPKDIWN